MLPFNLHQPVAAELPIIVSVPHCGTSFPDNLVPQFHEHLISRPDDTDWFVHKLYDFAPAIGMTMITAVYSRWVIDLNRDPESKPLYTDGRIITGLCPTTDFLGNNLYRDSRAHISEQEVKRRLDLYYWPYHQKLQQLIEEKRKKFGVVLLWDCHSIRQNVPTIFSEKFPDLILGDADERSASKQLIALTLQCLKTGVYSISHNHPFKGGFITRNYGRPEQNVHALQLEMSKVMYMDDTEILYDDGRANEMRKLLQKTLSALSKNISS